MNARELFVAVVQGIAVALVVSLAGVESWTVAWWICLTAGNVLVTALRISIPRTKRYHALRCGWKAGVEQYRRKRSIQRRAAALSRYDQLPF